jgi:hypothetical protein
VTKYEYRVVQSTAGAPLGHLNDRLNAMAEEGWEVVAISGAETVNVLMRRPKSEAQAAAPQPAPGTGSSEQ